MFQNCFYDWVFYMFRDSIINKFLPSALKLSSQGTSLSFKENNVECFPHGQTLFILSWVSWDVSNWMDQQLNINRDV